MGFGEAKQAKSVCLLEFANASASAEASVRLVSVPLFQKLEQVKGSWDEISARILELSAAESNAWLEVVYEGEEVMSDLQQRLNVAVAESEMEILRVKNKRVIDRVLNQAHNEETLDDLNVDDVFERCLAANEVPETQRAELLRAFQETLSSLNDDDVRAE